MKAILKPRRPSPDEALAIAASTAPNQPPAIGPSAPDPAQEVSTTLNLRMKRSTVQAIEEAAKGSGVTMKQVIAFALRDAGVTVAPADLEDRTPRRR